jgi:hypothetical protein
MSLISTIFCITVKNTWTSIRHSLLKQLIIARMHNSMAKCELGKCASLPSAPQNSNPVINWHIQISIDSIVMTQLWLILTFISPIDRRYALGNIILYSGSILINRLQQKRRIAFINSSSILLSSVNSNSSNTRMRIIYREYIVNSIVSWMIDIDSLSNLCSNSKLITVETVIMNLQLCICSFFHKDQLSRHMSVWNLFVRIR